MDVYEERISDFVELTEVDLRCSRQSKYLDALQGQRSFQTLTLQENTLRESIHAVSEVSVAVKVEEQAITPEALSMDILRHSSMSTSTLWDSI